MAIIYGNNTRVFWIVWMAVGVIAVGPAVLAFSRRELGYYPSWGFWLPDLLFLLVAIVVTLSWAEARKPPR